MSSLYIFLQGIMFLEKHKVELNKKVVKLVQFGHNGTSMKEVILSDGFLLLNLMKQIQECLMK